MSHSEDVYAVPDNHDNRRNRAGNGASGSGKSSSSSPSTMQEDPLYDVGVEQWSSDEEGSEVVDDTHTHSKHKAESMARSQTSPGGHGSLGASQTAPSTGEETYMAPESIARDSYKQQT